MSREPVPFTSDDMADGGLIDVRSMSLGDLLDDLDESSLAHALGRIFSSVDENARQNGFNNAI